MQFDTVLKHSVETEGDFEVLVVRVSSPCGSCNIRMSGSFKSKLQMLKRMSEFEMELIWMTVV